MSLERVVGHIERLLEERGWSKRRLACNMSMPKHRLMRVMRKGEHPSSCKLQRIADAFDVPVYTFFRPLPSDKQEQTYTIQDDGSLVWDAEHDGSTD